MLWVVPNWAAFLDVGGGGFDRPPKSVDDLAGEQFDIVITVCDRPRNSVPRFPGKLRSCTWAFRTLPRPLAQKRRSWPPSGRCGKPSGKL